MQYEQSAYSQYIRPGYYVRAYHRNTGAIQKAWVKEALKRLEQGKRETGPLEIDDMPTAILWDVTRSAWPT
jgi:hypothetical protein